MENGWLEKIIEGIESDLKEIKEDVKILREDRAEKNGRTYVIVGVITIAINILAVWLRIT